MTRDDEQNRDAAQPVHVREVLRRYTLRGNPWDARGDRVFAHVVLKVESALAA